MPIYYGNTKIDITSKGVVKDITTPPVPRIHQPGHWQEGEPFLMVYTPTGQYVGVYDHEYSYGYHITLVDDASQAALFLFDKYYPVDNPQDDYSLFWYKKALPVYASTGSVSRGALYAGNGDTVFKVRYADYNNVTTSMYAYIDYNNEKRNIYNITVNQSNLFIVSYSAEQEAIALPFKIVKYTEIPNGIDKVYYGNTLVYQKQAPAPTITPYVLFSSPNNNISLQVVDNTKYWDGTLETSTDNTTWTTWDGTTTVSTATGNLYVRGSNNTIISNSASGTSKARWKLTGDNISISGNIEALLDYQTVANGGMIANPADYTFASLFARNSNIIDASNLEFPRTTLVSSYCYRAMFNWCNKMTGAPALPATTLADNCYDGMFTQCRALTTPPALPATTLASECYRAMFSYCIALTSIPALPALQIPNNAYTNMFQNSTGIKLSTTQEGDYINEYRIPPTGTGVALDTQIALNMFTSTGGTFTGTPSINTTYYTSNTVIDPE